MIEYDIDLLFVIIIYPYSVIVKDTMWCWFSHKFSSHVGKGKFTGIMVSGRWACDLSIKSYKGVMKTRGGGYKISNIWEMTTNFITETSAFTLLDLWFLLYNQGERTARNWLWSSTLKGKTLHRGQVWKSSAIKGTEFKVPEWSKHVW